LNKIENKEKKNLVDLNAKQKTFVQEQEKKVIEQKSVMQTRHEFIKNLTTLQKNGYVIDRKKTYVEELALIMKECLEEAKSNK
jgi:DNA-binding transcriptional regulator YhcF (GntR family)